MRSKADELRSPVRSPSNVDSETTDLAGLFGRQWADASEFLRADVGVAIVSPPPLQFEVAEVGGVAWTDSNHVSPGALREPPAHYEWYAWSLEPSFGSSESFLGGLWRSRQPVWIVVQVQAATRSEEDDRIHHLPMLGAGDGSRSRVLSLL